MSCLCPQRPRPAAQAGEGQQALRFPLSTFTKTHRIPLHGGTFSGAPRDPGAAAEVQGKACGPCCRDHVWSCAAVEELGSSLRPPSRARPWFCCFLYGLLCRDAGAAPMSSEEHGPAQEGPRSRSRRTSFVCRFTSSGGSVVRFRLTPVVPAMPARTRCVSL